MTDWTEPRDWPVDHLVDATDLNTYLRDNLRHIRETIALPAPATHDPRQFIGGAGFNTTGLANLTYFGRVRGSGSVNQIVFWVATSAGNVSVAVYDNVLQFAGADGRWNIPNTRLATSGSVACPAVGQASISLGATIAVESGQHWFALSQDNVAATFSGSGGWIIGSNMAAGISGTVNGHPAPAGPLAPLWSFNVPAMTGIA
jgi:hypothetical protein